jgi:hypothetical protein
VQFLLPAGTLDQLTLEGVAWRAVTACHGELVPAGMHNQQQRPLSTAHGQPRLMMSGTHVPCDVQLTVKSSAGAVFASMPEVGAVTVAAWRMQLASALMLPVAAWQYLRASSGVWHREKCQFTRVSALRR